jgi:hypothetical protein
VTSTLALRCATVKSRVKARLALRKRRNMEQVTKLFSLEEAARILGGISVWTIRKHISAGHVKPVKIGRRVFLSVDVIDHIQSHGLPSLHMTSLHSHPESCLAAN